MPMATKIVCKGKNQTLGRNNPDQSIRKIKRTKKKNSLNERENGLIYEKGDGQGYTICGSEGIDNPEKYPYFTGTKLPGNGRNSTRVNKRRNYKNV